MLQKFLIFFNNMIRPRFHIFNQVSRTVYAKPIFAVCPQQAGARRAFRIKGVKSVYFKLLIIVFVIKAYACL